MVTSAPRMASDAAASQPMKPDPTTVTATPGADWAWRRSESSIARTVRMSSCSPPGTGRRIGSEPVARTQAPKPISVSRSVITTLPTGSRRAAAHLVRRSMPCWA